MKTVLNRKNVDNFSNPMFLGEDLSLQRYDQLKYPKFYELYDQQLNFFWRPQEVSLSKDIGDYQLLSNEERFVFDSNIKFQTCVDSFLSRSIHSLMEYVTNPELEICMNTWSFFETIHSNSYTYILQNVHPNSTRFFNSILEDKEIIKRAEELSSKYDLLLNSSKDPKQRIFDALIATQITEGVTFYVSFACSFYFGYRGKMEGNSKIIKLISRDENCLTEDAEALTQNGWKKIVDLNENDLVCQANKDKSFEFVKPNKIIVKDYEGEVYNFSNKKSHLNMTVSPDHRVIYQDLESGLLKEQTAEKFKPNSFKRIILAGKLKSDECISLSSEERFLIAVQADGNIPNKELRNGRFSGCNAVVFNLTKKRKQERLEELLLELGYEYSKNPTSKPNRFNYYVKVPIGVNVTKDFSDWVDFSKIDSNWCDSFIKECALWDGHRRNGDDSNIYYSSINQKNVEIAQTISTLCGRRTHVGVQVDNRSETFSDVHRLTSLQDHDYIDGQVINKTKKTYSGKLACVSVDSGMFLARQDGKPFVTGNCHVSITQNILKYLRDNKDEGFQEIVKNSEEKVYEAYRIAVESEKDWADYLFSKGNLVGLTAESLKHYVEWLANTRLVSMGYKKLYPNAKINPLAGWLDSFFDSKKVQVAPQETEISSYVKGMNTNVAPGAFDNFVL